MAKSPSKSAASVEVVEDSEEEQSNSKQKVTSDVEKSNGDAGSESGEEEYEIEAILDAKLCAFPGGRTGYLVKWKGYGEDQNSWVNEDDAEGANEIIEEYWGKQGKFKKNKAKTPKGRSRKSETKTTSPDADEPQRPNKRKQSASGRKSKSPQQDEAKEEEVPKTKKAKATPRARTSQDMEVDGSDHEGEYMPMDKSKYREKSWEKLVQRVDTIERADGVLKVFFTLNNGDRVVENSRECAKHFPQKLIQFYESNLRWRELE